MFGVTSVGDVSTTNFVPVPVCDAIDVALPDEVMTPVKLAFVVTVEAAMAVLHPKPVPLVHLRALAEVEHEGNAKSEGVVAVNAPRTVFAVCVASVAVRVPDVVTALDGVEDNTVPSPVKVTDVTEPEPALNDTQPYELVAVA
jgi:hypothetical protein